MDWRMWLRMVFNYPMAFSTSLWVSQRSDPNECADMACVFDSAFKMYPKKVIKIDLCYPRLPRGLKVFILYKSA